jgi:hypothetical protein
MANNTQGSENGRMAGQPNTEKPDIGTVIKNFKEYVKNNGSKIENEKELENIITTLLGAITDQAADQPSDTVEKFLNEVTSAINDARNMGIFYKVAQTGISNIFMEAMSISSQLDLFDDGDDLKIQHKGLTFILKGYKENSLIPPSTKVFIEYLVKCATESDLRDPYIRKSLNEYMRERDLSDPKSAREQVRRDIDLAKRIKIEYMTQGKRGKKATGEISLYGGTWGQLENGDIVFKFNSDFLDIFKIAGGGYGYMYSHRAAIKIDQKRYPDAFSLYKKIATLAHMKNDKPIPIISLLPLCSNIPTYEAVMNGNRDWRGRIIKKFEKNMNALVEVGILETWEYLNNSDHPTWESFFTNKVCVKWHDHPRSPLELENKAGQEGMKLIEH